MLMHSSTWWINKIKYDDKKQCMHGISNWKYSFTKLKKKHPVTYIDLMQLVLLLEWEMLWQYL